METWLNPVNGFKNLTDTNQTPSYSSISGKELKTCIGSTLQSASKVVASTAAGKEFTMEDGSLMLPVPHK